MVLFICIIIIILLIIKNGKNTIVLWSSFTGKSLPKIDDRHGNWLVCGKQGTYKTFTSVLLTYMQESEKKILVKTNIHSLKLPSNRFDIVYFSTLDELYTDTTEHCIFIIDEISRRFDRNSRTDKQFFAWLNQARKRKRITFLITQEFKELPVWLRRPCKFMVMSVPSLLNMFGLVKVCIGDCYNMTFDKDEGDYTCPPLYYYIFKPNQRIASMYDTFEPIDYL